VPIDVVIPAHNAAGCIAQAVASALRQAHVGRVIVVADACTDDTAQRARQVGADVVVERAFGSAAKSRNHGMALAQSTWVALLDADDAYLDGWLAAVADVADDVTPQTAAVFGGAIFNDKDGTEVPSASLPADGDVYVDLLTRSFFTTSATVFRKAAFEEAGGFDTSVDGAVLEDFELLTRLLAVHHAAFVRRHLVRYDKSDGSATRDPRHFSALRERGITIVDDALARRPLSPEDADLAYAQVHRMSAERFLAAHFVDNARRDLRAALQHAPQDGRLWAMALLSLLRPDERATLLRWRRQWRERAMR